MDTKRWVARMREGPSILAIVPQGSDRIILRALCRDAGWPLTFDDTLHPAMAGGEAGEDDDLPPIVLYDCRIKDQEWSDGVRMISRSSSHPFVILIAPTIDRNLWDELERVGGSDVLRSPIEPERARLALLRAWLVWRNRRHVPMPVEWLR